MPLILNGATSGSTTIQATDATTQTITLPANSGTVLTNASNTNFPAGSVLQVVNATYSTPVLSTSNTYITTNLTASITPSSSSNKILVIVHQAGCLKYTSNTSVALALYRGATPIIYFGGRAGQTDGTVTNEPGTISTCYLDSPATTSSTTYTTYFASNGNNATVLVQDNNGLNVATSTITLMEIKG